MPIENIVGAQTDIGPAFWLNAANGAVRQECGWHVAPIIEQTLVLDHDGSSTLMIPSLRVVQLLEVVTDGVDVTGRVDASKVGMLELRAGRWSSRLGGITVRLRHGYAVDEVPAVAGLIATLAKRAATTTVVASQSSLGSAVSYLTAGGAPLSIPLLKIEKDTLAPYRLSGTP